MCTSAWALVIDSPVTWTIRTAILSQTDGYVEIVAGGSLTANARVDHDGGVYPAGRVILNGGNLTSTVDYKLPDTATGYDAFIGIYDGTFTANALEIHADRLGKVEIGVDGTLIVQSGYLADYSGQTASEMRDNPATAIADGKIYATPGFDLVVTDLGGGACMISAVAPDFPVATDPKPGKGEGGVCPDVVLSWTPTDEIIDPNHDVYLDPNLNDVAGATRASHGDVLYYSENQDSNEYTVPAALEPNTTYFWRVDEVDNSDPCVWESPIIWSFTTEDGNAAAPDPPDDRRGVNPAEIVLNWTPSCTATAQQVVYFSTNFNEVNTMQPGAIEAIVGATVNNYSVGTLHTYTTYYWRIKTDTGGNGEVWTFKTGYGGLLMQYSFEGSLGTDITNPVIDDTGKITFTRYEGGGTLKYGEGRFGGTSAVFDSNVALYRADPNGPNDSDYLRLDGYQYSIHLWVKPTYLSGLDMPDQRLIGKRPGPWGIWINDPGSGESRNNEFRFVHDGPGSDNVNTADNTAREDEWVHLAAVYNQPDYDIYLNGIWAGELSKPPLPSDNNNPIGIGCRIDTEPNLVINNFFDGFMDELKIWDIAVLPALACSTNPNPPHLADRLDPNDANNTVLSWTPGPSADRHDVYFGTDSNVAYLGTTVDDGNMWPESGNLVLEQGMTYYWRIDDVNDADAKTYDGFLWNFTTESIVVDPNMVLWYKFDELYGEDVTDSSGYYNHGGIWNLQGETWDPCDGRYPGCINFDNDERIDVVDEVFDYIGESISISVWWKEAYRGGDENYFCGFGDDDLHLSVRAPDSLSDNPGVIWRAGNDTNDVLEWETDGLTWMDNWHHLVFTKNGPEGTMKIYFDTVLVAPVGPHDDANGTTLSQAAAAAIFEDDGFRIGANWDHGADFIGKADNFRVYDYEIPQSKVEELYRGGDVEFAWGPVPIDGATDVLQDANNLVWKPGDYAVTHDVYFGTDFDDVNDANTLDAVFVQNQADTNYGPGNLTLGKTYYWRIDEVNAPHPDDPWKGKVWSFTVANYLVIDDFESYIKPPDDLWETWGNPHWTGSFVETGVDPFDPVNGGYQSMKYSYDITEYGWAWYAEVERNFDSPQNWDSTGVKILTLSFYGLPGNDANNSEQMSVGLEDGDSNSFIDYGFYGEDMNDIKIAEWQEWDIALSDFTGVDMTDVRVMYIRIGDPYAVSAGGSGVVYMDDVRLYPPKCVPSEGPDYDFSGNCIVDWSDVEIIGREWLKTDDLVDVCEPLIGPVGHWEMDEGDSNTVSDSSVNNYHGATQGSFSWVAGKIGSSAIDFTGGKVVVTDKGATPLLNPAAEVSVTAWVNYSESPGYSARVIVKGIDAGAGESYGLQVNGNDELSFLVRDSNHGNHGLSSGETLVHDEWMHLAGVYDGNNIKVYVNGGLADSNSNASGFPLLQDVNDLIIGDAGDVDRAFLGAVDDARVYNYGLTDAEVAYIGTENTGHVKLVSIANISDDEPDGQKAVNFKDFALLMQDWLYEQLWPQ
ncbi:MAG: LamG-like jellyroll fold domain-containing protein [Planctomycetota bacterium]